MGSAGSAMLRKRGRNHRRMSFSQYLCSLHCLDDGVLSNAPVIRVEMVLLAAIVQNALEGFLDHHKRRSLIDFYSTSFRCGVANLLFREVRDERSKSPPCSTIK